MDSFTYLDETWAYQKPESEGLRFCRQQNCKERLKRLTISDIFWEIDIIKT